MSRITVLERDYSGFINTIVGETGAMVLNSKKGKSEPMYLQSEEDCIRELGTPSSSYPGVFEAIAFTLESPLWVVSAIGDNALYGGVDVSLTDVTGFGVGRDYDTFNYGSTTKSTTQSVGTGDGVEVTFSGTLTNTPITDVDEFLVKVGGTERLVTLASDGSLSGDDVSSGSVDLTTGVFTITFSGTPGEFATVTSDVDGSGGFDLSVGSTDKSIKITVDGTATTINLGQSASRAIADVVSDINTAVGSTVATTDGTYITVTGSKGSTDGNVTIASPSSGDSALTTVFSSGGTSLTDTGVSPVGVVPAYSNAVTIYYHYTVDLSSSISHSFFTTSPYEDDLAVTVTWNSGYQFTLGIYRVTSSGNAIIESYDYSLINEKDDDGMSLYYADVFDDHDYVQIKVNSAFTGTDYTLTGETEVSFSGGYRGDDPETGDYTTAWNQFKYGKKYRAKIFMDVYGTHASTIDTIIQTYQDWAQGITCVPLGYDPSEAISFRSALALDTDDIGLYHNWLKIRDDYNNSFSWISNVGSIGKKFAMMSDTYDAASPAGIDENEHGGQISDWTIIEAENDYTQAELTSMYNAQVNPIVLDDSYGAYAYGDQTLQVSNSDTSFVGTRRVYKYILDTISTQILRKQEFKLNDATHRLMAKVQAEEFIQPIKSDGWIREFKVVCDETNNTDTVLNNRTFILDLYIRITPNSQWITLRLTRLPQSEITVGGITI